MIIKKDSLGRYIVQPVEDDTKLYFDIDTSTNEPHLAIYQGHDSQLINDRLEALDCSNFLSRDDVDELIELLMKCKVEMDRKAEK